MPKKKVIHDPPGLDVYEAMAVWSEDDRGAFRARMDSKEARDYSPTLGYHYWGAPVGWDPAVREKYVAIARENRAKRTKEPSS